MSEQFLTACQHMLGDLVPYHRLVDLHKKVRIFSYLATIKMNKYIAESKREGNDNKSMSTEDKSVRL